MYYVVIGFIFFIIGSINSSVTLKNSPAYYREYYSDKKECERLLPRNQECYTVITWETKEVEDDN